LLFNSGVAKRYAEQRNLLPLIAVIPTKQSVFLLPLAPSKGGELRISPAGGGLRGWKSNPFILFLLFSCSFSLKY